MTAKDILNDLHEKLAIRWLKVNNKTFAVPTHSNNDSCIAEALALLQAEMEKIINGQEEIPNVMIKMEHEAQLQRLREFMKGAE